MTRLVTRLARLIPLAASLALGTFVPAAQAAPSHVTASSEALEQGIRPLGAAARARPVTLAARMAHHGVPGLSIAVIADGRIAWARGYGVRAAGADAPVDADTMFQAGAIAMPVTAAAALRLVEQRRLTLDRNINDALQSWQLPVSPRARGRRVTVARILSHYAGLNVPAFPGYEAGANLPRLGQILDGVAPAATPAVHVEREPGASFLYSAGGYAVLQQVVADIAREPFPEALEHLVLAPLEMRHSAYLQPLPESRWANAAVGHDRAGAAMAGRARVYPELAAAGLWSTPSDLARFAIAVANGYLGRATVLLGQHMASAMLVRENNGPAGLGLYVDGSGEALRFRHAGANAGYTALMVGYADGSRGAIVMANGDGGRALVVEVVNSLAALEAWPGFQPLRPE